MESCLRHGAGPLRRGLERAGHRRLAAARGNTGTPEAPPPDGPAGGRAAARHRPRGVRRRRLHVLAFPSGRAEAARAGDLVEVLDALADIGYILAGTIINHGMQDIYDDAFNEVHRSNMAKLVDGKVIRREDGKVLKPEGWQPPQLAQFLQ